MKSFLVKWHIFKFESFVMEPLISIITITFNAAGNLVPTMDSVSSQSFRNFEHIIIDGASTDNTLGIARSYPGVRILSEKDRGLYDAMNKGINMARGRYLLFLNAGDAFHDRHVLHRYAARAEKEDDIIFADTVIVDYDRKIVAPRHLTAPARLTVDSFRQGMLVCHQAFMVKKEIAPEYDLQYRFSADYDWTIRCMKNTTPEKCTNLNMIAIDYLSDGMTDRNKIASLKERYRIMSRHYGKIPTLLRHFGFALRALKRM